MPHIDLAAFKSADTYIIHAARYGYLFEFCAAGKSVHSYTCQILGKGYFRECGTLVKRAFSYARNSARDIYGFEFIAPGKRVFAYFCHRVGYFDFG